MSGPVHFSRALYCTTKLSGRNRQINVDPSIHEKNDWF